MSPASTARWCWCSPCSPGPDHERILIARRIEAKDRQIDWQICRAVRSHGRGDRTGGGGERITESQEKLFLFIKQKRIEEKND